jgi:plasmid segregation protein ParM
MNNILYMAIDAGKDSTKYVYRADDTFQKYSFKTKVQPIYNFGVDTDNNSSIVEIENEKYLIGDMVSESKLSFDVTKTSIQHKVAIYLAISKVLKKIEAMKIKIAIGVPLNIYKNAKLKDEYKNYIFNGGFVSMKVNGTAIRFVIEDVLVLPESIGPIYNSLGEFRSSRATVIDIGGLNSNICQYYSLVPQVDKMLTANKGANILKNKIAEALGKEYGVVLNQGDVEEVIRDKGILYLNGLAQNGSSEIITSVMQNHLEDIVNFSKSNELNIFSSNGKVVFTGGGSLLLKNTIKQTYPYALISEDAQFSNALAFYKVLMIKNVQA